MRWTPERQARLLELVRVHGPDQGRLAELMGDGTTIAAVNSVASRALRKEYRAAVAEYRATHVPTVGELHREAQRRAALEAPDDVLTPAEREALELAETFSWLTPVALPAPEPRACVYTASPVTMVAGDFHWPQSSSEAEAIFIETARRLRPETILLIGDLWDLMAYSKYDKDLRDGFSWEPADEVAAGARFLHRLETEAQTWGARLRAIPGNHEARWWAYLNKHAGALIQHPRAAELLDFKRWWLPEWSTLEWTEEDIVLPGNLPIVVTHGEIVRQKGAYSALAHGLKYHSGVIHGHTHRIGQSVTRVPALAGHRTEGAIDTYEIGCMAELEPVYAKKPDWANGFAIVLTDREAESNAVELVKIRNGKATVAALGGTVAA